MKLRIHLFEWPSRHNVHLALPLMLVLSFALHAASMFLFHTSFPRSNGSAERIASVTYILPGSPEASKLAPILAASDPALFSSADVGPNVWNLPKTAYVASFDEETPELKPLPRPGPSEFLPPDPGTAPVTVATIVPQGESSFPAGSAHDPAVWRRIGKARLDSAGRIQILRCEGLNAARASPRRIPGRGLARRSAVTFLPATIFGGRKPRSSGHSLPCGRPVRARSLGD